MIYYFLKKSENILWKKIESSVRPNHLFGYTTRLSNISLPFTFYGIEKVRTYEYPKCPETFFGYLKLGVVGTEYITFFRHINYLEHFIFILIRVDRFGSLISYYWEMINSAVFSLTELSDTRGYFFQILLSFNVDQQLNNIWQYRLGFNFLYFETE